METLSITDLKTRSIEEPGEYAVHAQVAGCQAKETRTGKPYYEVELADGGGLIKLKAWQDSPAFPQAEVLRGDEWVCATGSWSTGEYGLDARDWSMRPLKDDEIAEVLAGSAPIREKQAADYAYIESTGASLADPRFKALCALFLSQLGERFRRTAGARNVHHARRGGLVEHVAQMMRCADAICSVYPQLNRDLLLTGVLFHDCGKLWENCYPKSGFNMPHDFRAELMGHISIGADIVNGLWKQIEAESGASWSTLEPSTDRARLHLLHLILSHHGTLEWGSPVLPKTPEALALHHVDNIDAKLEIIKDGYHDKEPLSDEVFSKVWPLGGNIVRPLPSVGEGSYPGVGDPTEGGSLAD